MKTTNMTLADLDRQKQDYQAQMLTIEQQSQMQRDKYDRETRIIKWFAPVLFVVWYFAVLRFLDWIG
jgi:hypothetical protein